MKKILLIGRKDLILAFRDRAALLLMLAAPFALTLGLGFITGRLAGGSSSGLADIPIIVANQDGEQLGDALINLLGSEDLASLISLSETADPAAARRQVDTDAVAAAIIIPARFTQSIIPAAGTNPNGEVVPIELYTNPTRPTSVGVIKTILDDFVSQVEVGRVGGQVAVTQLIEGGLIRPQDAADHGGAIGSALGTRQVGAAGNTAIMLTGSGRAPGGEATGFDPLAYMAPGMALMFLMFTATNGGRTLLTERAQGTLPRLLISPTSSAQVLGGKTTGIYLTGVAQMLILITASALLFQLRWGAPFAVLVLILAAVAGAVGWGMLITALAKTPGQVSTIGSAVTLIFGILGGSFTGTGNLPAWFQTLSKITPNAWGLEGFTILALGGGLADILVPVAALLIMGATLFTAAVLLLNRRGLAQP
jgi:ABC-2 type transport system permease protein